MPTILKDAVNININLYADNTSLIIYADNNELLTKYLQFYIDKLVGEGRGLWPIINMPQKISNISINTEFQALIFLN